MSWQHQHQHQHNRGQGNRHGQRGGQGHREGQFSSRFMDSQWQDRGGYTRRNQEWRGPGGFRGRGGQYRRDNHGHGEGQDQVWNQEQQGFRGHSRNYRQDNNHSVNWRQEIEYRQDVWRNPGHAEENYDRQNDLGEANDDHPAYQRQHGQGDRGQHQPLRKPQGAREHVNPSQQQGLHDRPPPSLNDADVLPPKRLRHSPPPFGNGQSAPYQTSSSSPVARSSPDVGDSPARGQRWVGPGGRDNAGTSVSSPSSAPSPLQLLRGRLKSNKKELQQQEAKDNPIVISDDDDEPNAADPPRTSPAPGNSGEQVQSQKTFEVVSAAVVLSPDSPPPDPKPGPPAPNEASALTAPPPAQIQRPVDSSNGESFLRGPVRCRLCESDKLFSKHDFAIHLTFIHYKERIMKRIKWPYECCLCKFTPSEGMRAAEKADEMLMHYGCQEGVANSYYEQEISTLPPINSPARERDTTGTPSASCKNDKPPSKSASAASTSLKPNTKVECKLCDSTHDNERLLVRHLSLKHFEAKLCAELPKEPPYCCPYIDCGQERVSLHSLMLHYGCEHNVSLELYEKTSKEDVDVSEKAGQVETVDISEENDTSDQPMAADGDVITLGSPPNHQPSPSMSLPKYIRLGGKPTKADGKAARMKDNEKVKKHDVSPRKFEGARKEIDSATKQNRPSKTAADAVLQVNKDKPGTSSTVTGTSSATGQDDKERKTATEKSSTAKQPGKLVELDMFGGKKSSLSSYQNFACDKCKGKKTFVTQKSLNYHLVLIHYLPYVSSNPGPFNCLMCSQSTKERGLFVGHFVSDHLDQFVDLLKQGKEPRKRGFNRSKDAHPKRKSEGSKNAQKQHREERTSKCRERKSSTSTCPTLSEALVDDSDVVEKPKKQVPSENKSARPVATEKSEKKSDKTPREMPIPKNRVRQTMHVVSELSARQRLTKKWEDTSIPGSRHKIEELEVRLKEQDEVHKENLKKKAEEFERWIEQKEKALEEEAKCRKSVEDKLEQASVDIVDLNKKLEQAVEKAEGVEASLKTKECENEQLTKEKKALERSVASLKREMSEKDQKVIEASQAEKTATEQKEEVEEKLRDFEITVTEKEDELKELAGNHKFEIGEYEKKIKRFEKQIEHHKGRIEKADKEKKEKTTQMKEMAKEHKEVETELKEQIQRLTKENKSLAAKNALEKRQEQKKIEKDQGRVADLEEQLADSEKQKDNLSKERDCLLDSLDKLQKILKDFEVVLQEKNDTIAQQKEKIDDTESNLDEALQKIKKDQKDVDKEKKDMARQIKQLQSCLKDWETRQFTNVKLIAGLEKENSELKKKAKDFEENHTGAEDELYELSTKCRKLEKEGKLSKRAMELAEQERAKALARLDKKNEEVDTLKSRNLEFQSKVQNLEKALRTANVLADSHRSTSAFSDSGLDNGQRDLADKIKNQDAELNHLKMSLLGMQNRVTTTDAENKQVQKQLADVKAKKVSMERDYAKLLTRFESIRKIGIDMHRQCQAKHSALQSLKASLPPNSVPIKAERGENGDVVSADEPPPGRIPELEEGLPPREVTPSTPAGVINVGSSGNQIILNVPATVGTGNSCSATDDADEDVDVDGVDESGGVSPPRSSYVAHTISEAELRNFFPDEDNLPPLTFNNPSSGGSAGTSTPAANVRGKSKSKGRGKPVDVTGTYDENDDYVCGICAQYDPPDLDGDAAGSRVSVGWVGCDCERWFHKQCTKLSRFSDRFSCKSVKMKCLRAKGNKEKGLSSSSKSSSAVSLIASASSSFNNSVDAGGGGNDSEYDPLLI